jgi:hypothetical protein
VSPITCPRKGKKPRQEKARNKSECPLDYTFLEAALFSVSLQALGGPSEVLNSTGRMLLKRLGDMGPLSVQYVMNRVDRSSWHTPRKFITAQKASTLPESSGEVIRRAHTNTGLKDI